jgi:hypothetical protein
LHPAADLVNDLGAEPDHMEGIQHRDRVRELFVDRVGLAPERIHTACSMSSMNSSGWAWIQAL